MDQQIYARQIANYCLPVVRTLLQSSSKKALTVYFEQSAGYCDNFIEVYRKGSGFLSLGKPNATSPIASINIGIAVRPHNGGEWLGYSVEIKNPQDQPTLSHASEWRVGKEEQSIDVDKLPTICEHIQNVCATPPRADGTKPPQEAPPELF